MDATPPRVVTDPFETWQMFLSWSVRRYACTFGIFLKLFFVTFSWF